MFTKEDIKGLIIVLLMLTAFAIGWYAGLNK